MKKPSGSGRRRERGKRQDDSVVGRCDSIDYRGSNRHHGDGDLRGKLGQGGGTGKTDGGEPGIALSGKQTGR